MSEVLQAKRKALVESMRKSQQAQQEQHLITRAHIYNSVHDLIRMGFDYHRIKAESTIDSEFLTQIFNEMRLPVPPAVVSGDVSVFSGQLDEISVPTPRVIGASLPSLNDTNGDSMGETEGNVGTLAESDSEGDCAETGSGVDPQPEETLVQTTDIKANHDSPTTASIGYLQVEVPQPTSAESTTPAPVPIVPPPVAPVVKPVERNHRYLSRHQRMIQRPAWLDDLILKESSSEEEEEDVPKLNINMELSKIMMSFKIDMMKLKNRMGSEQTTLTKNELSSVEKKKQSLMKVLDSLFDFDKFEESSDESSDSDSCDEDESSSSGPNNENNKRQRSPEPEEKQSKFKPYESVVGSRDMDEKILCPKFLSGGCNDPECIYQHL